MTQKFSATALMVHKVMDQILHYLRVCPLDIFWCKPSNYSPTTDASYTGTADAPTDSWEPLPLFPKWSNYKFDGQVDAIDWQCPTDADHSSS